MPTKTPSLRDINNRVAAGIKKYAAKIDPKIDDILSRHRFLRMRVFELEHQLESILNPATNGIGEGFLTIYNAHLRPDWRSLKARVIDVPDEKPPSSERGQFWAPRRRPRS
jgi:hypothetical protein